LDKSSAINAISVGKASGVLISGGDRVGTGSGQVDAGAGSWVGSSCGAGNGVAGLVFIFVNGQVWAGNGVAGPVFVFGQVGAGGSGCGDNSIAGSVFVVVAIITAVTVSVAAAAAATMAVFVLVVVFTAVFAVIVAGVAGVAILAGVAFAFAAAVAIIVVIVVTDLLGFEVQATGTGGSELDGQV
jgi:hypothetical protein